MAEQSCSEPENANDDLPTPKKKKPKHVGAARYRTKFRNKWRRTYPVNAVRNDPYSFHSISCMKNVKCDHQGIEDVKDHCETEWHKKREKEIKTQPSIC